MTQDDIMSLKFFIEYRDITNWCDWDNRKVALVGELPELEDYLIAKCRLKAKERILLKTLEDRVIR